MDKCKIFMKNLQELMQQSSLSTREFAMELGIPRTTLQSAKKRENLSLYTAIQIADGLGIPLDTLINDDKLVEKFSFATWLLKGLDWYTALSAEKQEKILFHVNGLMEVLSHER